MQIAEGRIGRAFVVRLEDGDRLPECVERVARERGIRSGVVLLVGGARDGTLVVGPDRTVPAPTPMLRRFVEGHEIVGAGTLFAGASGPELHLHAALGRGDEARVGCVREGLHTYLVGEVVILELVGFEAARARDPASGFSLLRLGGG